jgi:hypothetical protein
LATIADRCAFGLPSGLVERYGRLATQQEERAHLLIDERKRLDHAKTRPQDAVKAAFMAGQFYFQGRKASPTELGGSFAQALTAYGNAIVPQLYPHPVTFSVSEKDIVYLIDNSELAAPPPVFGQERLGLLTLDAGRYEVTCHGRVPTDVLVADAVVKHLKGAREQLNAVGANFRKLPGGIK